MIKNEPLLEYKHIIFYPDYIEFKNARLSICGYKTGIGTKILKFIEPEKETNFIVYGSFKINYDNVLWINDPVKKFLEKQEASMFIEDCFSVKTALNTSKYKLSAIKVVCELDTKEFISSVYEANKGEEYEIARKIISNGKFKTAHKVYIDDSNTNSEEISCTDELIKLKALLDAGIITNEEFDKLKKKIIEK